MDITKAKRVIELVKDNRKVLVALWEGNRISSCIEEMGARAQRCETCEGDEELCNDYINHLKEKGYQATEILVSQIGVEESLPKFVEEREVPAEVPATEEPAPGEE